MDRIAGGPVPDLQLMEVQRAEQIRAAVLALPAEQRLRIWGELDYEQISAIEDVPVGTIRSRLARARDALRATLCLEELFDAG